jgi:hypothetical protein
MAAASTRAGFTHRPSKHFGTVPGTLVGMAADQDESTPAAPEPRGSERERRDGPVLPDVSRDELDVGWGDEPGERDEAWYRRERPPHHE